MVRKASKNTIDDKVAALNEWSVFYYADCFDISGNSENIVINGDMMTVGDYNGIKLINVIKFPDREVMQLSDNK